LNVLTQKNEVRKVLGYLPQEFGVYPKMSAIDMLSHLAILKGVTAQNERREMVEALLANPRLIIVDEPTAGLDPAERLITS
jgi:ABC-type multidrug transport system ATPase subunit